MAKSVKLEMTPLEYLATPADLYFEVLAARTAWDEGIKDAKADDVALKQAKNG